MDIAAEEGIHGGEAKEGTWRLKPIEV